MDDKLQFYVLHISTGHEQSVCRVLACAGWDARAPRELCKQRVRGEWIEIERVLIPGYVFVGLPELTAAKWCKALDIARRLCPSARFLGSGTPQPISAQEAAYLGFLAPDEKPLPPSVVEFDACGTPHIVSGPLMHLEESLQYLNLRQRRACVALPFLGKQKVIRMAVVPRAAKGGDAQ